MYQFFRIGILKLSPGTIPIVFTSGGVHYREMGSYISKRESDIEVSVVKNDVTSCILHNDTGKRIGTEILYDYGNISNIRNNHKYGSSYIYNYQQDLWFIKYYIPKGDKIVMLRLTKGREIV